MSSLRVGIVCEKGGASKQDKKSPPVFTGGLRSTHQHSTLRRIQHSRATAHAAAHTHACAHDGGEGMVRRWSHVESYLNIKRLFRITGKALLFFCFSGITQSCSSTSSAASFWRWYGKARLSWLRAQIYSGILMRGKTSRKNLLISLFQRWQWDGKVRVDRGF
jgi:hypothetical protein